MILAEFVDVVRFKVNQNDVKKVNDTIVDIKNVATKMLGAIGVGISLTAVNSLVEEFSLITQKVKNSTAELGEQAEIQQKILAAASATRTAYSQTAGIVSNLVQENSDLFGTIDEAINFNNAATMLFKTAGKTNEEIAGLMEAINKSFAKGKVDSETLSQLLEKAPEAVKLLNKQLGTTSDQLEQLATDGKFTVADLKAAFMNNADAIAASFGNVKISVTEALVVIRNKWGLWLSETNEMLGITDGIGRAIIRLSDTAMRAVTKIRTGVIWLGEKLGGVQNLVKLLGIVAGAIWFAFNFDKITTGIASVIKMLKGVNAHTLAIIAEIVLIALLMDDFINFMQGNDSLLGSMLEKAGVDCDALRETIISAWEDIKGKLAVVWDHITAAGVAVWEAIKKMAKAIGDGLRVFWSKWGGDIKSTLGVVWDSFKVIFDKIIDILIGVADFIGAVFKGDWDAAWQAIKDIFSAWWDGIMAYLEAVIATMKLWFKMCLDFLKGLFDAAWNGIKSATVAVWDSIKAAISGVWDGITSAVSNAINKVKETIANIWNTIKTTTLNVWNGIKAAITNPINAAWEVVKGIVEKLKNIFNFSWSLPKLKLPHITVTKGEAPYGIGGKGSLPKFDIQWYKEGGILDGATIFGAMGGKLLGGGEAGKEAVIPLAELWNQMRSMITEGVAALTRNLMPLAQLGGVSPTTAGNMIAGGKTQSIVVSNTFNQHFSGDRAAQLNARNAMQTATADISGELARAIALGV